MASTNISGWRSQRSVHSGSIMTGILPLSQQGRISLSPSARSAIRPSTSFCPSYTASQKETPRRMESGSGISVIQTRNPARVNRWATPEAVSPPPRINMARLSTPLIFAEIRSPSFPVFSDVRLAYLKSGYLGSDRGLRHRQRSSASEMIVLMTSSAGKMALIKPDP